MRLLRGEIGPDAVDAEFERLKKEAKETSAEKDVMKMVWHCQSCYLQGREDYMKPMEAFGVRWPTDFVERLLPQGAWTRCTQCCHALRGQVGLAGAEEITRQIAEAAAATHFCQDCGTEQARAARRLAK